MEKVLRGEVIYATDEEKKEAPAKIAEKRAAIEKNTMMLNGLKGFLERDVKELAALRAMNPSAPETSHELFEKTLKPADD